MVELTSMLGVLIQSDIEAKEGFDGLNEAGVGNVKLVAKIYKTAILVEET